MAIYLCATFYHFALSLCVNITSFFHHARMRWWYGKDVGVTSPKAGAHLNTIERFYIHIAYVAGNQVIKKVR